MTKNLLLVISFIPLSLLAQKNNFYGGGYEANILERNFKENPSDLTQMAFSLTENRYKKIH